MGFAPFVREDGGNRREPDSGKELRRAATSSQGFGCHSTLRAVRRSGPSSVFRTAADTPYCSLTLGRENSCHRRTLPWMERRQHHFVILFFSLPGQLSFFGG
jgi:hypothetical protein